MSYHRKGSSGDDVASLATMVRKLELLYQNISEENNRLRSDIDKLKEKTKTMASIMSKMQEREDSSYGNSSNDVFEPAAPRAAAGGQVVKFTEQQLSVISKKVDKQIEAYANSKIMPVIHNLSEHVRVNLVDESELVDEYRSRVQDQYDGGRHITDGKGGIPFAFGE